MNRDPDDEVLPRQTSDDTDVGWGEDPDEDVIRRLQEDRPPHHIDRE